MTRARLAIAHAVIAIVGVGSLACIIAGRDVWPFLSYPMYADLVRGRPDDCPERTDVDRVNH